MRQLCIFLTIFLLSFTAFSQIKVGDNVDTISPASLLELESTDQGVLLPRLTTAQRDAQGSWTEGHVIYNTTDSCFQFFDGNIWDCMVGASAPPPDPTNGLPFNVVATSAGCNISDYITEGAPDTLIKEDKIALESPSTTVASHWYQFQTIAAAMNNHNIIGFQTDNRISNPLGTLIRANLGLPDANRYIGKTFLLYSIPDSFYPDTSSTLPNSNFTLRFGGVFSASISVPIEDRAEDWENDYMTTFRKNGTPTHLSDRLILHGPTTVASLWYAETRADGGNSLADYPILQAPFLIITSTGPDDWMLNCSGILSYKNPMAP